MAGLDPAIHENDVDPRDKAPGMTAERVAAKTSSVRSLEDP